MVHIEDETYVNAATRMYGDEGKLEINKDAKVSHQVSQDEGAYVAAWVWVYDEDVIGKDLT